MEYSVGMFGLSESFTDLLPNQPFTKLDFFSSVDFTWPLPPRHCFRPHGESLLISKLRFFWGSLSKFLCCVHETFLTHKCGAKQQIKIIFKKGLSFAHTVIKSFLEDLSFKWRKEWNIPEASQLHCYRLWHFKHSYSVIKETRRNLD